MSRTHRRLLGATFAWVALVAVGFVPFLDYAATAGPAGAAAAIRPRAASSGRPQLLMVLHPRCACSRASLRELERLLARLDGEVDARALFVGGDGGDRELFDQATAIAGLVVERDPTGERARALGAQTSGDLYLYDDAGRLAFHGGLTAARGHEGATPALEAIAAVVFHRQGSITRAPVYGCRLTQRIP